MSAFIIKVKTDNDQIAKVREYPEVYPVEGV